VGLVLIGLRVASQEAALSFLDQDFRIVGFAGLSSRPLGKIQLTALG